MAIQRILMGVVLVCLAAVSPCLAEDAGTRLTRQVTALLEKHDAAFSAQDVKGVMKTYIRGPEIFLMGSGPGEIYRGQEGVEAAYNQFFTRFDKGSLKFSYNWVSAGSRRDMAWFAAEGKIDGTVKGAKKELEFNISGTLLKQKGAWRFLAVHFSRMGVAALPGEEANK
jgi:ketosteroid isomerase-like protein